MTYLRAYRALLELGAPVNHLGAHSLTHHADEASARVFHAVPTCPAGGTSQVVTRSLDDLLDADCAMCRECTPPGPDLPVPEPLSVIGNRYVRMKVLSGFSRELRAALPSWGRNAEAARKLLDGQLALVRAIDILQRWLLGAAPYLGRDLAGWVSAFIEDGAVLSDTVAEALRADRNHTSALFGVPLDGPERWVFMRGVPRRLFRLKQGEEPDGVALAAFWRQRGEGATSMDDIGRVLIAVPAQLADELTHERRHLDAGPVHQSDGLALTALTMRLLEQSSSGDPLAKPAVALTTARDILLTA